MPIPLSPADFAARMAPLGPFEPGPRVAVATSGGADSLALTLLAAEWAGRQGGAAVAVTVDHGLRPEAAAEAERVALWLKARSIPHHILRWQGAKPMADIQAMARAARYRLLEGWCRDNGVLHLLLGHHREDQAETLLLRLGRGSGVDGLAGMAAVQETRHLRLLRPLLDLPRDRLAATLRARGQDWIEDPSNQDAAYSRIRLRQLSPLLAAEGLAPERLAATARRLGRARAALEQAVAEAAAHWVSPHRGGWAVVDPRAFRRLPEEIGLRLMIRLVLALGGGIYPPRQERAEALFAAIRAGLTGARTLAGCRVAPLAGSLLFCREAGRMAAPVPLVAGAEIGWDGRFRALVAPDAPAGLTLGALGPQGWRQVLALSGRPVPRVPAAVRPTLPAVYGADGIFAVPHLGYNRNMDAGCRLRWIVAAVSAPLTVPGHCLV